MTDTNIAPLAPQAAGATDGSAVAESRNLGPAPVGNPKVRHLVYCHRVARARVVRCRRQLRTLEAMTRRGLRHGTLTDLERDALVYARVALAEEISDQRRIAHDLFMRLPDALDRPTP